MNKTAIALGGTLAVMAGVAVYSALTEVGGKGQSGSRGGSTSEAGNAVGEAARGVGSGAATLDEMRQFITGRFTEDAANTDPTACSPSSVRTKTYHANGTFEHSYRPDLPIMAPGTWSLREERGQFILMEEGLPIVVRREGDILHMTIDNRLNTRFRRCP